MKVITERDKIRDVAEDWRKQYADSDGFLEAFEKLGIYVRLTKLDVATATAEDVAKIIGNDSWTRLECQECGKDVKALIEIGSPPDYESSTARVCLSCIGEAHIKLYHAQSDNR